MPLIIDTREVAHVTILDINGRIVLGPEIGTLRDAVRSLVKEGKKKIILNLADVDYLDSSGVGELVGSFTTVRNAGGELKLLNLTQKVHDVLHVTKLYTVFDIKDDEFTAVKSFDYFFAK
jgi:anti-sigma B factor antagonist